MGAAEGGLFLVCAGSFLGIFVSGGLPGKCEWIFPDRMVASLVCGSCVGGRNSGDCHAAFGGRM